MYNISFQIWLFWVSMLNFRGYYFVISGFWRQAALLRACWQKLQSCQTPSLGGKKTAPRDGTTWRPNQEKKPREYTSEKYQPKVIQCRVDSNLWAKLSATVTDSLICGTIAIRIRGSTLQPSALCCLWPITESISQSKAHIDSRPLQFWRDLS